MATVTVTVTGLPVHLLKWYKIWRIIKNSETSRNQHIIDLLVVPDFPSHLTPQKKRKWIRRNRLYRISPVAYSEGRRKIAIQYLKRTDLVKSGRLHFTATHIFWVGWCFHVVMIPGEAVWDHPGTLRRCRRPILVYNQRSWAKGWCECQTVNAKRVEHLRPKHMWNIKGRVADIFFHFEMVHSEAFGVFV